MGCGASKPAVPPPKPPQAAARRQGGGGGAAEPEEDTAARVYAYGHGLRQRALPLIEARSSCENLEMMLMNSTDYTPKEEFAALRIQKQLRRKLAKVNAERDQKWMIFSNLDAFDEAEMVKLAQFMEIAMERVGSGKPVTDLIQGQDTPPPVPGIGGGSSSPVSSGSRKYAGLLSQDPDGLSITPPRPSPTSAATPGSESDSASGSGSAAAAAAAAASGSTPLMAERSLSHEKLVTLDMSQITVASNYTRKGAEVVREYDLPQGVPVTATIAKHILDVYKHGGKLSAKAVIKLLRLSYRRMQALPNITRMSVGSADKLHIVGDIHGQLPDLMHILNEAGLPSPQNKFIFNGDFVDRGPCGVEVMCVLMSLFLAFPDSVALNRGNHEDFAICCVYGFQKECCEKYDADTFGMFSELFQQLPLFCTVNDAVFVLHGGLFHDGELLLAELNAFDRTDFSLKDLPEGGDTPEGVPRSERVGFFKQVQRDALWSDPVAMPGLSLSSRGAGINFGPDITKAFLRRNNLRMVVRSHEVCRTGFELPFAGACDSPEEQNLLCTIFSASNYSGGGNSAAYMTFTLTAGQHSRQPGAVKVPGCDLQYRVLYFHIDPAEEEASTLHSEAAYTVSLHDLILKKREFLLEAFELADVGGPATAAGPETRAETGPGTAGAGEWSEGGSTGCVTKAAWTEVMQRVLQLQIRWMALIPELVPDDCLVAAPGAGAGSGAGAGAGAESSSSSSGGSSGGERNLIDYRRFVAGFHIGAEALALQSHRHHLDDPADASNNASNNASNANNNNNANANANNANSSSGSGSGAGDAEAKAGAGSLVDSLYQRHKELYTVFSFFDRDRDGLISKEEFKAGCSLLLQMGAAADKDKDKSVSTSSSGSTKVSSPLASSSSSSSSTSNNNHSNHNNNSTPSLTRASSYSSSSAADLLRDCEALMSIMDINGRGVVDINEFFEMFRVSASASGAAAAAAAGVAAAAAAAAAAAGSGPSLLQRRPSTLRTSFSMPKPGTASVEIEGGALITSDPELARIRGSGAGVGGGGVGGGGVGGGGVGGGGGGGGGVGGGGGGVGGGGGGGGGVGGVGVGSAAAGPTLGGSGFPRGAGAGGDGSSDGAGGGAGAAGSSAGAGADEVAVAALDI